MNNLTNILLKIELGDLHEAAQLLPLVYEELRKLAAAKLIEERPGQTLQATALVHEAYLRLVDVENPQHWKSRGHFFGAAAEAMRRILVEQARRKGRDKHGGGVQRIELPADLAADECDDKLLALDAALPRLAAEDSIAAEIVKLKYFTRLSREEIASVLGMTVHEVRQKWAYARAWLRLALES
jgi:RNA polymerase sigma factor (TIGR02999 family)